MKEVTQLISWISGGRLFQGEWSVQRGNRLAFLKNNKESRITELKWVKEKEENNIKEIMGTWSSRSFARTDSHCDKQSMFLKEKWDAHIYLTTTTTTKEIK